MPYDDTITTKIDYNVKVGKQKLDAVTKTLKRVDKATGDVITKTRRYNRATGKLIGRTEKLTRSTKRLAKAQRSVTNSVRGSGASAFKKFFKI